MKSLLLINLFFVLLCSLECEMVQAQQRVCNYCGGKGRVVKNLSVSQYGVKNEAKVQCRECGNYYFPSTGHTHIHCSHCSGTGYVSSGGSGRSDGTTGVDLSTPLGAAAYSDALTLKYGLPVTEEEQNIIANLNRNNPNLATRWINFRNTMDMATITFNRELACVRYVMDADIYKRDIDQKLAQIAGSSMELPQDLYNIYKRLYERYEAAYRSYRAYYVQMRNIEILKERQFQLDLLRNSLLF